METPFLLLPPSNSALLPKSKLDEQALENLHTPSRLSGRLYSFTRNQFQAQAYRHLLLTLASAS
jgi:hypothetical protein